LENDHVQPDLGADDQRGGVGTPKRAREDRVRRASAQEAGNVVRLLPTKGCQRRVQLALPTLLNVPLRFSMPGQENSIEVRYHVASLARRIANGEPVRTNWHYRSL
jgi:hypothetical protein